MTGVQTCALPIYQRNPNGQQPQASAEHLAIWLMRAANLERVGFDGLGEIEALGEPEADRDTRG